MNTVKIEFLKLHKYKHSHKSADSYLCVGDIGDSYEFPSDCIKITGLPDKSAKYRELCMWIKNHMEMDTASCPYVYDSFKQRLAAIDAEQCEAGMIAMGFTPVDPETVPKMVICENAENCTAVCGEKQPHVKELGCEDEPCIRTYGIQGSKCVPVHQTKQPEPAPQAVDPWPALVALCKMLEAFASGDMDKNREGRNNFIHLVKQSRKERGV